MSDCTPSDSMPAKAKAKKKDADGEKSDDACGRILNGAAIAYAAHDMARVLERYQHAFMSSRRAWTLRYNCMRGYCSVLREETSNR